MPHRVPGLSTRDHIPETRRDHRRGVESYRQHKIIPPARRPPARRPPATESETETEGIERLTGLACAQPLQLLADSAVVIHNVSAT